MIISYVYPCNGSVTTQNFGTIELFQEFMDECHPDVSMDEFFARYNKKLAETNSTNSIVFYCFVGGNELIISSSHCGIMEKWYEYQKGYEKVNENYIHTYIAHNWSFDKTSTGTFKITYWYDKNESGKSIYKIHQFKDKVVFENSEGVILSTIVTNDHYVHYAGLKKGGK